jgi:hypothetical protein
MRAARAALGEEEFRKAWSEGESMTGNEAIQHGLESLPLA